LQALVAFAARNVIGAIKRDILPRRRITDRLEVREHSGTRNRGADIALYPFKQVMSFILPIIIPPVCIESFFIGMPSFMGISFFSCPINGPSPKTKDRTTAATTFFIKTSLTDFSIACFSPHESALQVSQGGVRASTLSLGRNRRASDKT
jgi:hypothetical protein